MLGGASFPACRMTQPAREESNSFVKNCGNAVGDGCGVKVGAGVSVNGTRVGESVAVGKSGATGVGVAAWQAEITRRHPRTSLFMMLIKTQLSSALFQTMMFNRRNKPHN